MWSGISLSFWFAFSWKISDVSIFSYVCWSFVYLLWRNIYSLSIKKTELFSFLSLSVCYVCIVCCCLVVQLCQTLLDPMASFFFLSVRSLMWKCFLLFCGIWKFFLDSVLSYAKVLNFDESNLSFLLFSVFWGSYLSDHYLLKGYEDLLVFFL